MARLKGWEDEFINHAVFSTLTDIGVALEKLRINPHDFDEEVIDEIARRVDTCVMFTNRTLGIAIPILMNETAMNKLQSQLQNLSNQLNNYLETGNDGHLQQANTETDGVVAQVRALPIPAPEIANELFSASANAFRASLAQFRGKAEEYEKQVSGRITQLNKSADDHGRRLEVVAKNLDRIEQAANASAEKVSGDLLQESQETLSELEGIRDQARALLGVIGQDGITAGFDQMANKERGAANATRIATGVAVLIAVGVLSWLFASAGDLKWWEVVARLSASVALFALSGYLGNESSTHRRRESTYRQMALELSALGPYLAPLDESKRNAKIEAMADRLFGRELKDEASNTVTVPLKEFLGLIRSSNK